MYVIEDLYPEYIKSSQTLIIKKNQLKGKNLNRHLTRVDLTANKLIEKCPTSLVIRDTRITTVRSYGNN